MSKSDRPVRSTRSRDAKVISTFGYDASLNDKWTTQEKQLLLEALKIVPATNLALIKKNFLPDRKLQEIDLFIKRMKNKAPAIDDTGIPGPVKNVKQAPIEAWLEKAEDLTYHDFDYSYILSQVLSVAGNLEQHDIKQKASDPEWSKLYSYVVSLLRGDPTPELGSIESLVMLDLIEGLADQLKNMDTSLQQELMRRKYKLLTMTVDVNNKQASYAAARRALEEDLLETETLIIPDKVNKSPKKRGRKRKGENASADVRPTKTPLYSINPFCIPVKYLKPKSTRETSVLRVNAPQATNTVPAGSSIPQATICVPPPAHWRSSSIPCSSTSADISVTDSSSHFTTVRDPPVSQTTHRSAPTGRHNTHVQSTTGYVSPGCTPPVSPRSHGDSPRHISPAHSSHLPAQRKGPKMLLPRKGISGHVNDGPYKTARKVDKSNNENPYDALLQNQSKTKRISIKETESGTTTIQISDIM